MRVVAIDKMEGSREDIDQFAIDLFDKWQLGKSGILIVISIKDRKITSKINPAALLLVSSNDAKNAREKIHDDLKSDRWDWGMRGLIQNYHTIVMEAVEKGPAKSWRDYTMWDWFCAIIVYGLMGLFFYICPEGGSGDDDDDGGWDCDG